MASTTLTEFEKAVQRLKEALDRPKDDFIRDSVIQRFEFCIELAWKSARKALGVSSTAPKVVLRDLAQQGLIADPARWFAYLEARNQTSHTYKEELAEKVYQVAKEALPELEKLLHSLKAI